MSKFKVGNWVKGTSNKYAVTNRDMTKGEVTHIYDDETIEAKVLEHRRKGQKIGSEFTVESDDFELIRRKPTHEIHITSDGETTHAVYKEDGKVVKRTKSIKRPEEEFNFKTGAGYAFTRIFAEDKEEFKPHLETIRSGRNLGIIGEPTKLVDYCGNKLFVGDEIVIISIPDKKQKKVITTCFVISDRLEPVSAPSIAERHMAYKDNIAVRIKSYKDLKHGDSTEIVRAVLKEDE